MQIKPKKVHWKGQGQVAEEQCISMCEVQFAKHLYKYVTCCAFRSSFLSIPKVLSRGGLQMVGFTVPEAMDGPLTADLEVSGFCLDLSGSV